MIKRYHDRYSASVWAIIYQADVRARLELSERLRRRGESEHQRAQASGLAHTFNPAAPWDWVWQAIVAETCFWEEEFEEPAL